MNQIVLAIDTSQGTSVALLSDGVVISEAMDQSPMLHAENIGKLIANCLADANLQAAQVTDVAVGVGPGPFTGLRVGIAAAKMFAAGTGAKLHGVGSLDAIAFDLELLSPTLVLSDARRSEVYFGLFEGKSVNGSPKSLLGPGVSRQIELEEGLKARGQFYELVVGAVSASAVGLLALAQIADGAKSGLIQANYLREPDATQSSAKKVSG